MLIALRQAQFTYLTPAPPPRYRDGATPLTGRGHQARHDLSAWIFP